MPWPTRSRIRSVKNRFDYNPEVKEFLERILQQELRQEGPLREQVSGVKTLEVERTENNPWGDIIHLFMSLEEKKELGWAHEPQENKSDYTPRFSKHKLTPIFRYENELALVFTDPKENKRNAHPGLAIYTSIVRGSKMDYRTIDKKTNSLINRSERPFVENPWTRTHQSFFNTPQEYRTIAQITSALGCDLCLVDKKNGQRIGAKQSEKEVDYRRIVLCNVIGSYPYDGAPKSATDIENRVNKTLLAREAITQYIAEQDALYLEQGQQEAQRLIQAVSSRYNK